MRDYRKLNVWHAADANVLDLRKTTNRFPRTGYATLKRQLIGAAESIVLNIVEGCGSATQKELARFLDIIIKSSSETEYQLQLARDYGVLPEASWNDLSGKTVSIRKMLCRLRAKVINSIDRGED